MAEELPVPESAEERESRIQERKAFNRIADELEPLSEEARIRLFQLLVTHFDLAVGGPVRPSSVSSPQLQHPSSSFSEDRTLSPKQFMIEKKPVTDVERIACLAYYLTHYRMAQFFKTLDLSQLNTEAAQVKFSNAAKAVENAAAAGLLAQAGGGKKMLSSNGELYVQALPDREAAKAAIAHTRHRRRSSSRGKSTEPKATDE